MFRIWHVRFGLGKCYPRSLGETPMARKLTADTFGEFTLELDPATIDRSFIADRMEP